MQIIYNQYNFNPSFKGFRTKDAKAIVGLDLDGCLAHKIDQSKIDRVMELAQKANADVVYITGRHKEKFEELQKKLASQNIFLPTKPLFGRNGLMIYKNQKNTLIEDKKWRKICRRNFPEKEILQSVQEFAFQPENLMPKVKPGRKKDFKDSKIHPFSFWPVPQMLSFIIHSSLSPKIDKTLETLFKEKGLKNFRITKQLFSKAECDKVYSLEQLAIVNPRYGKNKNKSVSLDITAANKADSIKYYAKKHGISINEILTVGDELNDVSTMNMTKEGAFFVQVANASKEFQSITKKRKSPNLIRATQEGAAGIVEGMETVLKKYRPDLNL